MIHLAVISAIAWHLIPDELVHVSQTVPMPNTTVELLPAQGIEPAVFFTSKPGSLNAEAAELYRIHDDGTRELIGKSHAHPKRRFGLQFDGISDPGTYEIVINDGENGVVPFNFDGEYSGHFPTGNNAAGGAFRASFKVAAKPQEILTATLYDPKKPEINEESAAKSIQNTQQPQTPPEQKPEKKPQKKPEKKPEKKPQKPKETASEAPKSPDVHENLLPVTGGEATTEDPSKIVIAPENLRLSPLNIAPELLAESATIADQIFAERDSNRIVREAETGRQRTLAAYNSDGPVIGVGHQGNSVSHSKEVEEYLALMHKEIHPLWAHGYLLRLDTIYRKPGSRLDNSNLEAVLEITLNSVGTVTDVRVVKSSGISDYDSAAIDVAWHSSPQIAPPHVMISKNGKSYVHWTFWRDGRQCGVFGVKVFKLDGTSRDALNFSLKAVNQQERKLGLTPSVMNTPGTKNQPNPQPDPSESQNAQESLPQRINPLED